MKSQSIGFYEVPPRKQLWKEWISRHELIAFFSLAFLFSWSFFVFAAKAGFDNYTVISRITLIGAYGPAIAALVLSRAAAKKQERQLTSRQLWVCAGALVLAAGSEILDHAWWGHTIDLPLVAADAVLVALAALTITRLVTNRSSLSAEPVEKISWAKRIPWMMVALGLWPLLVLASNAIAGLLGWGISAEPAWPARPLPLILAESFLWYALFGGPLNEEPGWRGFALPRLQNRFSPLMASFIIGFFWGLWHIPQHLLGMYGGGAFGALIRFMDIPRAVLFTWVYNRTKGSLLIAILFHAAVNTTSLFLARSHEVVFVLCFVVAGIVILADKMWRKPPATESLK